MSATDPFADTDPEDMAVDGIQKKLDEAKLQGGSRQTSGGASGPTLVSAPQGGSSSSGSTNDTCTSGCGSGQSSTTLSVQIRKLKNAATAPRILGGGSIIRTTSYGSLLIDDSSDNQYKLAQLRELYDQKLNVLSSFDPASLTCSNCFNGPHQVIPVTGTGLTSPACFILSDQNFPAALPTAGAECCVTIIRVEDATLADLTSTFLMMTKGCDIGIGSVLLLSSLNHLGRVGSAAYTEDLLAALQVIRTTFGGQVRALHGFPLPMQVITDQITIRGLMEVESWLAMADQRRAHSLAHTSTYFIDKILLTELKTESSSIAKAGIPLRLPASIYSKEKASFVGLGWPKLAKSLAATTEKSEMDFLKVMLKELNSEFALQLDTEPVLDRLVHTSEVSTSHIVVFAGGSHASRIAAAARSTYPEVVDLSIGGWKLTKESAADLAQDLSGVLEEASEESHTVLLHLFDNSIYKGEVDGELTDPIKLSRKFHIRGKLKLTDNADFKNLFEMALLIIRACCGSNVILLGPLPRFLLNKCCEDPSHSANFGENGYIGKMGNDIRELGKHLRNLAHLIRLKQTKVLNPAVLM